MASYNKLQSFGTAVCLSKVSLCFGATHELFLKGVPLEGTLMP